MTNQTTAYGKLCSLFYDATKKYAPERELSFFASFIEKNPGRVLEAMCGSGRLLIPLMQRGYTVDGVDNSTIMLERCRMRAAELNLVPQLYEQSLEELNLPHKYSVITIAVGSFQLITDCSAALQVLKKLHVHMQPHGSLLIDFFVPDMTADLRSVRLARLDHRTEIRLTTRYVFEVEQRIAYAFSLYELMVDGVVQEQENELLQVTWYSNEELQQLLNQAGFEVITFYEESFRSSGPSRIVHARAIKASLIS